MKILHIIESMNPKTGGPAQGIRNSYAGSIAQGIQREIVCFDDPDEVKHWSECYSLIPLGRASWGWRFNPKLIPWLRENAGRYDCVIVNGLWLFPSFAAWWVLGKTGLQWIPIGKSRPSTNQSEIRDQGRLADNEAGSSPALPKNLPSYWIFTHGMLDPWFQKAPERRWKAMRNWFYWKLLEHRVIRDAAGLLFTCEEELILARTSFRPYQPKKELNVGYGIAEPPPRGKALATAFYNRLPELEGQPFLLFMSRIHPKKGVDLLIQAYGRLAHEIIGTETASSHPCFQLPALVIAGPGLETEYGRRMNEMARVHCPHGTVHFPGMLEGNCKWGAVHACEAFILPSHQENFGIAVVEALACEKPVLISDQVNIWREIKAAKAGLINQDSLEGTCHLLRQWLALPSDERSLMQRNARQCYLRHFQTYSHIQSLIKSIAPHSIQQHKASV